MRVFVSHASVDKLPVRGLCEIFERAGVTVWDYVDPTVVNLGADVDRELERQLAASRYVVVVASCSSLANPLVRREVELAVALGFVPGRLLTVVLPDAPHHATWSGTFTQLATAVFERLAGLDDLERAGSRVLAAMGHAYVPRSPQHARLPAAQRTQEELASMAAAQVASLPQESFNQLVRMLDEMNRRYVAGAYREAESLLDEVSERLRRWIPSFEPYYLGIAATVCDLHLGNLARAADRLEHLATHPLRDESWYAARGTLSVRCGHHDEARRHFLAALERCRDTDQSELEVLVNLCLLDGDAGTPLPQIAPHLTPREALILRCARAQRLLALHNPWRARDELRDLPWAEHDESSVLLLAQACEELDDWHAAIASLESFRCAHPGAAPSPDFVRVLARSYVAIDLTDQARALYAANLGTTPTGRAALWIEYARLLRLTGDRVAMCAICLPLITDRPGTDEEYYCRGFAFHLLDRAELAEDQYGQSRAYGRRYADVLHEDDHGRNAHDDELSS